MRNINNSDNRINVDNRNYSVIARFRQEDDATLVVNLYKNASEFDVSNQTVTLRALRADNQCINQTDNISKNKNIVTINFRRNILSVVGRTSIQLNISDSAGQFTTAEFFIEVEKNNLGADVLKGSDNVQALQQILIDFKAEKNSLIKNITDDYNSLKKIIISQNQAADLQNQININKQQLVENTSRIEQLEDLTPVWQEHEGAGSITVNDSFDGVTKDLVVRGRTLFNIYNPKKCNGGTLDGESFRTFTLTSNPGWHTVGLQTMNSEFLSLYKTNTMYTIITEVAVNTLTGDGELFRINENAPTRILNNTIKLPNNFTGILISKVRTKTDFSGITHGIYPCLTSSCTGGTIKIRFMIIEGDLSENEIPSTYFDSITSTGEQEDNKIKIKSIGKNLFDSELELGSFDSATGNETPAINRLRTKKFIKLNKGNYTISNDKRYTGVYLIYDISKNFIGQYPLSDKQQISLEKTSYLKLRTTNDLIDLNVKFQIEEGTKATNYEQYRSKLIEIHLPFQKGLKSLPNGKYDELKEKDMVQRIGVHIFDGSRVWTKVSDKVTEDTVMFSCTMKDIVKLNNGEQGTDLLCDKFNPDTGYRVYHGVLNNEGIYISNGGNVYIRIKKSKLATENSSDFVNWLRSNPVTMNYELSEPIIHKLNETINLSTFDTVTHITQENNILSDISFKAKVSLSSQAKRLKEANRILKEENVSLKESSIKTTEEQEVQDQKITTAMLANTELFEMMLNFMPMQLDDKQFRGGEMNMVEVYVTLIIQGDKTLEQVPAIIKPQVEAKLRLLGVIS